jgi:hypothetical protein
MMSMDATHVHAEEGREHGKIRGNITPAYEHYMKVGVMLNPPCTK